MIEVKDLSFSYGRKSLLKEISFQVSSGECMVIAGPNGSGKSTLLSLLTGALKPKSGSIRSEGSIAILPQGTALFEDMSVEDNLRFFAGVCGVPVPETLPFGLERYRREKLSTLSGGSKKRVSLACSLLGNPANLLLDEPIGGLDASYRSELSSLIISLKQSGHCLLYVGHDPLEYAAFVDRILFIGPDGAVIKEAAEIADPDAGRPDPDRIAALYESLFSAAEQERNEVKE